MEYFIKEEQPYEYVSRTAGIKARSDLEYIFRGNGIREILLPSSYNRESLPLIKKFIYHYKTKITWNSSTGFLKPHDILYIQFPVMEHTVFISGVIRRLEKRGVTVVLFIHDLEMLRDVKRNDVNFLSRFRIFIEETKTIRLSSFVISHNKSMTEWLVDYGVLRNRIVELEIFDYIIPDFDLNEKKRKTIQKDEPVIIAGNFRKHKSQYVYNLPNNISFNLYGVDYSGIQNGLIRYYGAFPPEEIPIEMYGSFGLVWDGICADTCTGVFGDYLKVNNPHKASLYLASGIPVIIWEKAALAEFIIKHNVGFTINSLNEIQDAVSCISKDNYDDMCKNARSISANLRKGFYCHRVICTIRNRCKNRVK